MEIMFSTERCKIRRFKEEDIDDFMTYRNNEHWMKYQLFKGLTKEEYRKALLNDDSVETGIQLAVSDIITDMLIGDIYLKKENEVFWIGYTISPDYSRQGYMYEIVVSLIRQLKTVPECTKIAAGTDPENTSSKGLLKKLGFDFWYFDDTSNEEVYILDVANYNK
jgi:RimJ/RimL family protein N-acetyltransferase